MPEDAADLARRWRALPWPARWAAVAVPAVALAAAAGEATPLGWRNGLFLAGALAVLASALFIRTGGPGVRMVRQPATGHPLGFEAMAPDERRAEIGRGVRLFLLGLAMWAPLAVDALV